MNQADIAIQYALAQIGKPYCWGGTGPRCYDCSGLVMMSYRAAGLNLPRTVVPQLNAGQNISRDQLLPGDLISPDPGHIQLYVGNGAIVEAPRTGLSVRTLAMWGFWRASRVTTPGGGAGLANAQPTTNVADLSKNAGCLSGLAGATILTLFTKVDHGQN